MSIKACGVLPVSVYDGDIYVLCGKEKYIKNWDGSDRFAGFGGRKEQNETNRRCAARECYEESMGFLGTESDIFKKLHTKHDDYIGTSVMNSYKCYWIQFPYDPYLPDTYRNVYEYLKKCDSMTKTAQENGCFEKTELMYFKLTELCHMAKHENNYTKKHFRPHFLKQILFMVEQNPESVFSLAQ